MQDPILDPLDSLGPAWLIAEYCKLLQGIGLDMSSFREHVGTDALRGLFWRASAKLQGLPSSVQSIGSMDPSSFVRWANMRMAGLHIAQQRHCW